MTDSGRASGEQGAARERALGCWLGRILAAFGVAAFRGWSIEDEWTAMKIQFVCLPSAFVLGLVVLLSGSRFRKRSREEGRTTMPVSALVFALSVPLAAVPFGVLGGMTAQTLAARHRAGVIREVWEHELAKELEDYRARYGSYPSPIELEMLFGERIPEPMWPWELTYELEAYGYSVSLTQSWFLSMEAYYLYSQAETWEHIP